jgi:hypothetical protein
VNVLHNPFKGIDYISNERVCFPSCFKLQLEEFLWQYILEMYKNQRGVIVAQVRGEKPII